MAIDTNTKKLSMMEWCSVWEPGLPLSPGTIDQADQQHFLWGYSGISWTSVDNFLASTVHSPNLASTVHSPNLASTVKSPDLASTVKGP